MLCIHLKMIDPFFCLATEEYLLKNFTDNISMLWQSKDTVVVGKHQNALAEINYPYVHQNNIKVARRISGGGTVFHDSANLNFAYIKNVSGPSEISFSRFVKPIVEALGALEIQAVVSGRNDLLVDGKKISGNAEHIFKNRVLHHGTLLFDSNLETLGRSIKVVPGKYHGKAVQSNRSVVTNILPYLKQKLTIDEFTRFLLNSELAKQANSYYDLNDSDFAAIQDMVFKKFSTWEWNFGYSPKYSFRNQAYIDGRQLNVELQTERGHITEASVTGDYFSPRQAIRLNTTLKGSRHFHADIYQGLLQLQDEIPEDVIDPFF